MKKSTKGAAAAGAAAVLLLGGASSLAYWNADGTVAGGAINSGSLTLTAKDAGTWKLNGTTVTAATAVVVPGDELVYTGSYTIGATGNNIQGNLTVTGGTGTPWTGATRTSVFKLGTTTISGTTAITKADNNKDVSAEIKIDFPFGSTADNTSQSKSVSLANVGIALVQTDATPVVP